MKSRMKPGDYHEGYWERGEGSNYVEYGDDPGWPSTLIVMLEQAAFPNSRLLEVACAKGYFVGHARRLGLDCEGVDISDYALSKAPQAVLPYVHWANVAEGTPFENDAFDVVCAWEFMEHVYEDELDAVLGEMERVLRLGGEMWLRIGIDMEGDPAHQQQDVTHHTEYPREWWEARFADRGWKQKPESEKALDEMFVGRDWLGRFFVYEVGAL